MGKLHLISVYDCNNYKARIDPVSELATPSTNDSDEDWRKYNKEKAGYNLFYGNLDSWWHVSKYFKVLASIDKEEREEHQVIFPQEYVLDNLMEMEETILDGCHGDVYALGFTHDVDVEIETEKRGFFGVKTVERETVQEKTVVFKFTFVEKKDVFTFNMRWNKA